TIKGLAGFLELWEVQKLAHEVETILDRARNSELLITPPAIDVVLQSADYLKRWIRHLELRQSPTQAPARDESLLSRIQSLYSGTAGSAPASEVTALAAAIEAPSIGEAPGSPAVAQSSRRNEAMAVKVDTAKLDYLVDMAGEMVIAESLVRHDSE